MIVDNKELASQILAASQAIIEAKALLKNSERDLANLTKLAEPILFEVLKKDRAGALVYWKAINEWGAKDDACEQTALAISGLHWDNKRHVFVISINRSEDEWEYPMESLYNDDYLNGRLAHYTKNYAKFKQAKKNKLLKELSDLGD